MSYSVSELVSEKGMTAWLVWVVWFGYSMRVNFIQSRVVFRDGELNVTGPRRKALPLKLLYDSVETMGI